MKKILCVLLCAFIIILPLCSCGKDDPSQVSASDAASEHAWLDEKFDRAELLCSWFKGCGRPATDADSAREHEGAMYAAVTEPELNSLKALEAALKAVFTDEVTAQLLATEIYDGAPVFREFDGRLYFCTEVQGLVPRDIGRRTGEIISRTDIELVYRVDVTYDYYASVFTASYDYVLTLGEDSKWYFSAFELPAMLIAEQMFMSDE